MRLLDRLLQRWRVARAAPWVRPGDRLLDVGCFDATLIRKVRPRVASALGIDPLAQPFRDDKVRLERARFPMHPAPEAGAFDCITLLAVLEHVADPGAFATECRRVLGPGGRVILTVPHPWVDRILEVLLWLRLVDGMSAEQHHGFEPGQIVPTFVAAGFRLVRQRRFQCGLNHLFVFEKPGLRAPALSGTDRSSGREPRALR